MLVDTLRADHVAVYGYHRPTSPELARFARRAVRFETVQSQAGCTFPSVNSLLTSRYPFHFLGQPQERRWSIPQHVPSLPEILAEHGYSTAVDGSPKPWVERGDPLPIIYTRYQGVEHFEVTARDVEQMVDLYDEEIVYFDDQFGELLAGLEERGRLENTLIAVASDHGEAWLEHGIEESEYGHCRDIALQSVMATPLLLRLPGQGASGVRRALFRWIEAIEGRVGAAESLQKTDELERRLKAVGYL